MSQKYDFFFLVLPPPNKPSGIFSPFPRLRHDGTFQLAMCICVINEVLLLHGPTCIMEHPASCKSQSKGLQALSMVPACSFGPSVKTPCCSQVCTGLYSCPSPLIPAFCSHVLSHCSFVPSLRCLFLASALVTVYSNHRMLGMRLVSLIKKNSEAGHAAILGNKGVKISCVNANQAMAMMLPATPPYKTWLQVW